MSRKNSRDRSGLRAGCPTGRDWTVGWESGTGPILVGKAGRVRYWLGKRDGSDIVKLGGPADVRAIFTRARHFDFGPPFAGDPWDDRPTLGACPRIRVRNPQVFVIKQLASFEPN